MANLVSSDSEPEALKTNPDSKGTWKERKKDTIRRVTNGNKYEKMLACADKLANLTDIDSDLKVGINIWSRMNASKKEQKWYYESMLKAFNTGDTINSTRMYKLLKAKIQEVWSE